MHSRTPYFRTLFSREFSIIKRRPTFYIALIAVLSGISIAFMYVLHFPVFPPPFNILQFDLADICVAVAAIMLGPLSAVTVALIKCLLFLPRDWGQTMGVGVLSNFICAFAFGVAVALVYHLRVLVRPDKRNDIIFLIIAFISGAVIEIGVAMLGNYYIFVPLYMIVFVNSADFFRQTYLTTYYIFTVVPLFNLLQFGANGIAGFLLAKALLRIIPRMIPDFFEKPPEEVKEHGEVIDGTSENNGEIKDENTYNL